MANKKKPKCVRCESLERPQKSKSIYYIINDEGESIPLCATCIIEVKEEEIFLRSLAKEDDEDEQGGEIFDI